MPLSREEKERFLRAVEEDREFRYALMGLLGFREVLDQVVGVRRGQEELARALRELVKTQQELAKRQQRLEERQQRLEERQQKLEERFAGLEERFARLEERQQRLEERMIKLEERQVKVEDRVGEFERVLLVVSHRFGVIGEEAFREAMRYVVEEALGAGEVERWVYKDEEGVVYGHPSVVEVDVLVRDKTRILVEVKSRVSRGDVLELKRIGGLYERVEGVRPRLVIVGGFIDRGARSTARRLGVEIKPISRKLEQFEARGL